MFAERYYGRKILFRLVGCYVVYGNKELLKGGIAWMAKSSLVIVCIFCCWGIWSRVVRKFLTLFIGPCPSGCIINIVNIWCMDNFFFYFSKVLVFSFLFLIDSDFYF